MPLVYQIPIKLVVASVLIYLLEFLHQISPLILISFRIFMPLYNYKKPNSQITIQFYHNKMIDMNNDERITITLKEIVYSIYLLNQSLFINLNNQLISQVQQLQITNKHLIYSNISTKQLLKLIFLEKLYSDPYSHNFIEYRENILSIRFSFPKRTLNSINIQMEGTTNSRLNPPNTIKSNQKAYLMDQQFLQQFSRKLQAKIISIVGEKMKELLFDHNNALQSKINSFQNIFHTKQIGLKEYFQDRINQILSDSQQRMKEIIDKNINNYHQNILKFTMEYQFQIQSLKQSISLNDQNITQILKKFDDLSDQTSLKIEEIEQSLYERMKMLEDKYSDNIQPKQTILRQDCSIFPLFKLQSDSSQIEGIKSNKIQVLLQDCQVKAEQLYLKMKESTISFTNEETKL